MVIIASLLLASCGAAGDYCAEDSECPSGLICSATAGKRGVCTYPSKPNDAGLPDAKPTPDAAPAPDAATPDATSATDADGDRAGGG